MHRVGFGSVLDLLTTSKGTTYLSNLATRKPLGCSYYPGLCQSRENAAPCIDANSELLEAWKPQKISRSYVSDFLRRRISLIQSHYLRTPTMCPATALASHNGSYVNRDDRPTAVSGAWKALTGDGDKNAAAMAQRRVIEIIGWAVKRC